MNREQISLVRQEMIKYRCSNLFAFHMAIMGEAILTSGGLQRIAVPNGLATRCLYNPNILILKTQTNGRKFCKSIS